MAIERRKHNDLSMTNSRKEAQQSRKRMEENRRSSLEFQFIFFCEERSRLKKNLLVTKSIGKISEKNRIRREKGNEKKGNRQI